MKDNVIKRKSFDFALEIVEVCKVLVEEKREFVLTKQVLRSGTAVGALVRESEHSESKKDFIHKLAIALKEANETEYWLELLYRANYLPEEVYQKLIKDIKELLRILISIVKTSKGA
jgi:four helix bundle protein